MHDVVAGKPVARGYILVDCLGGVFFESLVNLRNSIAEAVKINIACHNKLLFLRFANRDSEQEHLLKINVFAEHHQQPAPEGFGHLQTS